MIDYTAMYPEINIDELPPEALEDEQVIKYFDEIKSRFEKQSVTTLLEAELNMVINELRIYLNETYPFSNTTVKLEGSLGYEEKMWDKDDILKCYKKVFPHREVKENLTNMDINNMLFNLNLEGIIKDYNSPAICYDIPSHNNKIFDGAVMVEVMYYWEDYVNSTKKAVDTTKKVVDERVDEQYTKIDGIYFK